MDESHRIVARSTARLDRRLDASTNTRLAIARNPTSRLARRRLSGDRRAVTKEPTM